jgi:hypothetical protein
MTEPTSAQDLFKRRHFDQEIIVLCIRWYLTFKLSSRDLVQMVLVQIFLSVCFCRVNDFPDFRPPRPWPTFPLTWSDDKVVKVWDAVGEERRASPVETLRAVGAVFLGDGSSVVTWGGGLAACNEASVNSFGPVFARVNKQGDMMIEKSKICRADPARPEMLF